MIVVFPFCRPGQPVPEALPELTGSGAVVILCGTAADIEAFSSLKETAVLLPHPDGRGKGRAIKTALSYIKDHFPPEETVVLADGAFSYEDIRTVSADLEKAPGALVLGRRQERKDVSPFVRLGRALTRKVFSFAGGVKIQDIQTGLRAFSASLIPRLLTLGGDKDDYEVHMLLDCAQQRLPIREVPVDTVYYKKQRSGSKFRAFWDTLCIYGSILKFAFSSLLSFLVDFALFRLFMWIFAAAGVTSVLGISSLKIGNIAARAISSTFNFTLNRKLVFKDRNNLLVSALKYYALVLVILFFNTYLLSFFATVCHIPVGISKLMTEAILFFVSMIFQRLFVFRRKKAV